MENIRYSCKNCNEKLNGNDEKCPRCGNVGRKIEAFFCEDVGIIESRVTLTVKNEEKGRKEKKYVVDNTIIRKEMCHDRQKMVERYNRFDHRGDIYKEVVTDPDTGEVIYESEESLKEHTGHGSAKYVKEKI